TADLVIEALGALGRTAGAVDVEDQRSRVRFADGAQRRDRAVVAGDETGDAQLGDVVAPAAEADIAQPQPQYGERGDDESQPAPESHLPRQSTAIQQIIRGNRHSAP